MKRMVEWLKGPSTNLDILVAFVVVVAVAFATVFLLASCAPSPSLDEAEAALDVLEMSPAEQRAHYLEMIRKEGHAHGRAYADPNPPGVRSPRQRRGSGVRPGTRGVPQGLRAGHTGRRRSGGCGRAGSGPGAGPPVNTEGWQSGRMYLLAKQEGGNAPGVRIPVLPPGSAP